MEILKYDLVCIGSGVAGMMASIAAANSDAKVCLVSKEPLGWGNTRISGGIISTKGKDKKSLLSDMLKSGNHLNQISLLTALLDKSVGIHELIESWGHIFVSDQDLLFQKKMIKPGGHSEARTLISHQRGILLSNILRSKLLDSNTHIIEEVIACKVITQEKTIRGVLLYDWKKGKWVTILSPKVILACGGGGMVYAPHTDNMRSATGDGYALGLNAGANLIDMEQIQFMPFGIVYPQGMLGLELGDTSAAGPYGVLKNKDGKIICRDMHNKTREEVSKKIALEIALGNSSPNGGLWLDPTENRKNEDGEESWKNWKSIGSLDPLRLACGAKAFQWQEPFEVLPTQHYIMGGVQIDDKGNTSVPGLMAVGETAGGIHGAGRMGSMSLFEGLVFGKIIGKEVIRKQDSIKQVSIEDIEEEKENFKSYISKQKGHYHAVNLKQEIGEVMWKYAGIIRSHDTLNHALNLLSHIELKSQKLDIEWENGFRFQTLEAIELRFMLTTSKSIILSALARRESRGSHYREDYPNKEESNSVKNMIIQSKHGELIFL
ncbi:FAD-binding protein [Neobacillus niacini]|uniref:FAD-binding protein n=1 Tax=Neobacillus niacini TaxID=86668 RepID=UPI002FFF6BBC